LWSSRAFAATNRPGVQKPLKCRILKELPLQRVEIMAPPHALDRLDRVALGLDRKHKAHTRWPSTVTLHATQSPELHPSLLPVGWSSSRNTSSRVSCGSHRNSVGSPLIVVDT
jgi:hypothetical protein